MEVLLVSLEGEEVSFSDQVLDLSEFLKRRVYIETPNPFMKIDIGGLGINSEILWIIKDYLQKTEYNPKVIRNLEDWNKNSFEYVFIFGVSLENLLLLVLAAHKLGLTSLQSICSARIAEDFISNGFMNGLDIQDKDNDHIDFLLTENKESLNLFFDHKPY